MKGLQLQVLACHSFPQREGIYIVDREEQTTHIFLFQILLGATPKAGAISNVLRFVLVNCMVQVVSKFLFFQD